MHSIHTIIPITEVGFKDALIWAAYSLGLRISGLKQVWFQYVLVSALFKHTVFTASYFTSSSQFRPRIYAWIHTKML